MTNTNRKPVKETENLHSIKRTGVGEMGLSKFADNL
jgi:hypothetical protein